MKNFIDRALKKLPKMTWDQVEVLLASAADEIDRFETVLESLTEGVVVSDQNHKLLLTNKYSERFLGIGSYEPRSQPIWQLIRNDVAAEFLRKALQNGDRVVDEEFTVEIKGVRRLLSINVFPMVKAGRVIGSIINVKEITEKRAKEARLRRAENLASLTTLAAGVAHEIKNPLASISIHIQLLEKVLKAERKTEISANETGESSFDTMEHYIGVINEEIDRLNHIVVDFLFAVRPMNIEPRDGDINSLLSELTDFVRFELEAAHIEIKLELGEVPLIPFDERYMKQALLNLIKNAKAAMPDGGTLTVKTGADDAEVHIHISDNGVGIPEENLPKIFEPYFTTKDDGMGLGLTMVYKIIKEHQGEIAVNSKDKMGSSFVISLPRPRGQFELLSCKEN